jgi:RNA 3'-terminal phosphate cyclase-like protein
MVRGYYVFIHKLIVCLGTRIEINETGTTLRFKPGILIGGRISHDCGLSRSIGWFIEGILPLAPFCKTALEITFSGITNDDLDLSADVLANVTIPLLKNFGIYNVVFKIKKRGMPPKGGGIIEFTVPPVRSSLNSVYIVDEGLIKRVRGVAFCTRISPTILTRVVDSCRKVLNDYLPDVHIHTDHYKGSRDGGDSPGYSLSLVAETTTGVLLSIERTARTRRQHAIPGIQDDDNDRTQGLQSGEMPEDIGAEGAKMLLNEVYSGGVVDRAHQALILQLMVLTPEDVSKVRFGTLSPQAVDTLRIIRDAFGVVFRVKEDRELQKKSDKQGKKRRHSEDEEDEDENEEEDEDYKEEEGGGDDEDKLSHRVTFLLSCLGIGYSNVNRRVT